MKRAIPILTYVAAGAAASAALCSGAWFADDALRLWRMGLNWIYTGSPDFSRGHHVLAFSQPLWVILLSIGASLGVRVASVAIALQFLLCSVAIFLLFQCDRLSRGEERPIARLAKILAIAGLLALSNGFREFITAGLEFSLVFFLSALLAWMFLRWPNFTAEPVRLRTVAFVCSLLLLARMDMAWALVPLAAFVFWRLRHASPVLWRSLFLGGIPLGLWLVYSWIHFGTVFSARPENFVLRGLPRSAVVKQGELYLASSLVQDPFTFLLLFLSIGAAWVAYRSSKGNPVPLILVAGCFASLGSILWTGGDFVGGRMFCPVAILAATALAASPAFRLRTYLFAGCFACVFFNPGRASLLGGSDSRKPRTVALFRDWGIMDAYSARHVAPLPSAVGHISGSQWAAMLRAPRSSEPRLLTATPGWDGVSLGPGREVEDWRTLGPARPELEGTVEFTVKFADEQAGVVEPVLSFGSPEDGTQLQAEHLSHGGLRFQIWRKGEVPVFSQAVRSLGSGGAHKLVVQYGQHAAGGGTAGIFSVMLDGIRLKDVSGTQRRYDRSEVVAGWNVLGAPGCLEKFQGEITELRPASESALRRGRWPLTVAPLSLVDLRVKFSTIGNSDEPIIVTGRERAGDIVFVRRLDAGKVVLGVEHWGEEPFFGSALEIDDRAEHRLTVALGPLFAHSDAMVRPDCIRVTLDGREALETRKAPYPFAANEVYALDNPLAGSFASRDFQGDVLSISVRSTEPEIEAAKAAVDGSVGPISMSLRFDGSSRGWGLGLLEAGMPGAGCIAYVVNEDGNHVRFYLDHWGVGAVTGQSIKIDRKRAYELKIEMGALNDPADKAQGSSDLIRYTLDGKVVLEGTSHWPPSTQVPVQLLDNAFHSSNVASPFDGTCLWIERGGRRVYFKD